MTSLARVVLRTTGPHRNLPHVFRGQLRHLHENAEKPVFRWEVCRQLPLPIQLLGSKWQPNLLSISRTRWKLRVNSLERKSQFGVYNS